MSDVQESFNVQHSKLIFNRRSYMRSLSNYRGVSEGFRCTMFKKIKMARHILVLSLCMVFFLAAGSVVFAAGNGYESTDLFLEAFDFQGLDAAENSPVDSTIVRRRFVKINPSVFVLNEKGGIDQGRAAFLDLNLFGGIFYRAYAEKIETNERGNVLWSGRIEGEPLGHVTLVYDPDEDMITANVSLPGEFYQIRHAGNGLHAVQQADHSRFNPCETENGPNRRRGNADNPDSAADRNGEEEGHHGHENLSETPDSTMADDGSTVDVLVVYTNGARSAAGGTSSIESEIDLAITETNNGYSNSDVNHRVNLVHTAEVTYSETSNATDVNRLQATNDGYMDNVHTLRDTHKADIVILLTTTGSGRVYEIMSPVSSSFENKAFGVVNRTYSTGNYTFGHEIGHLMSARHDWYVDNTNNSPYTYNHGLVNAPDRWRTVMAYGSECSPSCTRILYWSNPNKTYGGDPMGVAEGQSNAADNHKTLNNTAYTVANFRLSGGTPPAGNLAQAIDNDNLTVTTSGNGNWSVDNTTTYYDGDSAKAPTITHNQSASFETTISGYTTVKFFWKVSSESNYDYVRFYIDGVEKDKISGNTNWAQKTYTVTSGSHTLKWSYTKDGSVSSNSDTGWVDKLELDNSGPADPIAAAVDASSLTFTLSGNQNWYVDTSQSQFGGSSVRVPSALNHNQSATMQTTISGVTSVKFYWKVSSEANYDYLRFYIDGVEQDKISGSTSWAQKTYTVSSGSHTLKWTYDKDYSVSSGSDTGWVDHLELQ